MDYFIFSLFVIFYLTKILFLSKIIMGVGLCLTVKISIST